MLGAAPLNDRFWHWFGRSKIVTDAGAPLVVYHATRSPLDFVEFATGTQYLPGENDWEREVVISSSNDPGAYIGPHFTADAQLAARFAKGEAATWDQRRFVEARHVEQPAWPRVIPVYLRIENPIYFDSDEEMIAFIYEHGDSREIDDWIEAFGNFETVDEDCGPGTPPSYAIVNDECMTKAEAYAYAFGEVLDEAIDHSTSPREIAAEELGTSIKDYLVAKGYDGVIYRNTIEGGGLSYIAFEPWQIKSAIGNQGTWSLHSGSIVE